MTYNFRLTRERSTVSSKYDFEFIGNSRLAVVPVLQRYEEGYRIIGTGSYFIRPNTFITAAHIFEGDDIKPGDSFYIVSEAVLDYPLKVIEIYKYESFDLAFLVLEPEGQQYFEAINPLAVMNLPPLKNEIVAVFGFSHSIVNPEKTIEVEGKVMQPMQLRSKWELGGVLEIHHSGTRLLKGQCFETSVLAEGRDSGAPMFNSSGFMVGLLSTSWNFEDGLPNSLCTSILELADIQINGVPVKDLWTKKPRAAFCRLKS